MTRDPARVFIAVLSVFSIIEGGLSVLVAASERADSAITFIVKMDPTHGALHVLNGCVGLLFLRFGTDRACRGFAAIFGVVYALLGVVGAIAGSQGHALGLGLRAPDHPLHVVIGCAGVFAAWKSSRRPAPSTQNLSSPRGAR